MEIEIISVERLTEVKGLYTYITDLRLLLSKGTFNLIYEPRRHQILIYVLNMTAYSKTRDGILGLHH